MGPGSRPPVQPGNKLLVDPWATHVDRPFRLDDRLFDRDGAKPDDTARAGAEGASSAPPHLRRPRRGPSTGTGRSSTNCTSAGFTKTHPAIPRGDPRHIRRPRPSGRDRPSDAPRRHHRGTDAQRRVDRRAAFAPARPDRLLGLQPDGVPRPRPAPGAGRLARGDAPPLPLCRQPGCTSCWTSC